MAEAVRLRSIEFVIGAPRFAAREREVVKAFSTPSCKNSAYNV